MNSSGNRNKNKQIAKNTVALYIRMVVMMVITLFTSRIVLKELGVTDYGLYNVVGGVVTLFAFLRSSMSSSTQRFLSFEMGKGNVENLRNIFSICFSSHLLIAAVLFILAETLGLWFLNSQINIPDGRLEAANYIFHFSVLSLCVGVVSIPYTADIISNEKMGYFAFLGVFDAVLKLIIAYMIATSPFDKLVFYGFLMFLVVFINLVLNWIYCYHNFAETHYRFYWDKESFKKVFSFSGWTIVGQMSVIGANQGTSVLVNIFYSVVANASMGIAQQVNNALTGLTANFQTAFQPQITKSYAAGEFDYLNQLIYKASKISFFLLFLVSLPIMMNIDLILQLWLGKVPEYANEFCIWYIIASLLNAVSAPLWIAVFATGKIRNYQIVVSGVFFSDIIVVYFLFKYFNCSPTVAMMVKAFINLIVVMVRLFFTKKMIPVFSVMRYAKVVVMPIIFVCVVSLLTVYVAYKVGMYSWMSLVNTCFVFLISSIVSFRFGFSESERNAVLQMVVSKIK